MTRRLARTRAAGFTLAELLVATTLAGLVVVAAATLILQVSGARHRMELRAEHDAQADAAIHAITTALQNAFRNPGDEPPLFEGSRETFDGKPADRLRLFTIANGVVRPGQPESGIVEVEFALRQTAERPFADLVRRTDPTRNTPPDTGGVIDRVASNITALEFQYFDGEVWLTEWPVVLRRLPVAVRVKIGVSLDPDRGVSRPYSRLIHLPMLPEFQGDTPGAGAEGPEAEQGGRGAN